MKKHVRRPEGRSPISSRSRSTAANAIAKTIVRHKTIGKQTAHGDVRLSHGEHLREGGLRRDDAAGRGHGGLPLSGRMAAQRASRRGAGLLRPRLADDRARAGLFRRSSPKPGPTRSTRSSRGSSSNVERAKEGRISEDEFRTAVAAGDRPARPGEHDHRPSRPSRRRSTSCTAWATTIARRSTRGSRPLSSRTWSRSRGSTSATTCWSRRRRRRRVARSRQAATGGLRQPRVALATTGRGFLNCHVAPHHRRTSAGERRRREAEVPHRHGVSLRQHDRDPAGHSRHAADGVRRSAGPRSGWSMGLAPLSREEETAEWQNSVDLIMEDDTILIRPDPDNMELAFPGRRVVAAVGAEASGAVPAGAQREGSRGHQAAGRVLADQPAAEDAGRNEADDRGLEDRHPRRRVVLLQQGDGHAVPDLRGVLRSSAALDEAALRQHLAEIREFSAGVNRHGRPEVAFFMAGEGFSKADFAPYDFAALDARDAAEPSTRRCGRSSATPSRPSSATTTSTNLEWRNRDVRRADRRGREGDLRGIAAGAEFRVLHADRMAAGRTDRGGRIDLRSGLRAGRGDGRPRAAAVVRREVPRVHLQLRPRIRRPGVRQHRPGGRVAVAPGQDARPPRRLHRPGQAARHHGRNRQDHPHAEMGHPRAPRRRQAAAGRHHPIGGVHRVHPRPPAGLPPTGHEPAAAHHRQADQRAILGTAPRLAERA